METIFRAPEHFSFSIVRQLNDGRKIHVSVYGTNSFCLFFFSPVTPTLHCPVTHALPKNYITPLSHIKVGDV
jgi:hypothetical protein